MKKQTNRPDYSPNSQIKKPLSCLSRPTVEEPEAQAQISSSSSSSSPIMALELWETLKDSITAYTGLAPTTFFTLIALALAFYYVVSELFGSPDHRHQPRPREFEEQMQPLPPPVQLGEISEQELKQYDGSDSNKPLLMAIKGQIYDVSQSRA